MLLSGQTGYEARAKEHMMMEFSTIDRLDAQPSPRIFNTHLHFSMLPVEAMRQKKIKVTGRGGGGGWVGGWWSGGVVKWKWGGGGRVAGEGVLS